MRNGLLRLWNDHGGSVIALEWVFVAALLLLGTATGLVAVRQTVLAELTDAANAVLSLPRSCFSGIRGEGRRSAAGPDQPRPVRDPLPGPSEVRACD